MWLLLINVFLLCLHTHMLNSTISQLETAAVVLRTQMYFIEWLFMLDPGLKGTSKQLKAFVSPHVQKGAAEPQHHPGIQRVDKQPSHLHSYWCHIHKHYLKLLFSSWTLWFYSYSHHQCPLFLGGEGFGVLSFCILFSLFTEFSVLTYAVWLLSLLLTSSLSINGICFSMFGCFGYFPSLP